MEGYRTILVTVLNALVTIGFISQSQMDGYVEVGAAVVTLVLAGLAVYYKVLALAREYELRTHAVELVEKLQSLRGE